MIAIENTALRCSFCGARSDQVSKLLAGPGVCICGGCVEACNRILDGEASGAFAELAQIPDAELLETLRATSDASRALRDLVQQRVDVLRARGITWEEIGASLGISRQAAWERFSS